MHNTAFDDGFVNNTATHSAPQQDTPCEWLLISMGAVIPGRVNSLKVGCFAGTQRQYQKHKSMRKPSQASCHPGPIYTVHPETAQSVTWIGEVGTQSQSLRLEFQGWIAAHRLT